MLTMTLTDWQPTAPEDAGAVPRYRRGDIVLTKCGEVGVITEACVNYNGRRLDGDERVDEPFVHGHPPKYALCGVNGFKLPSRYAWWTAGEFEAVRRLVRG